MITIMILSMAALVNIATLIYQVYVINRAMENKV
jgi:hypothetical protein